MDVCILCGSFVLKNEECVCNCSDDCVFIIENRLGKILAYSMLEDKIDFEYTDKISVKDFVVRTNKQKRNT